MIDLDAEVELYEAKRWEWVREHDGEFVVIQDFTVLGFFESWEQAFKAGIKRFGGKRPFLVKEVLKQDRVYRVYKMESQNGN